MSVDSPDDNSDIPELPPIPSAVEIAKNPSQIIRMTLAQLVRIHDTFTRLKRDNRGLTIENDLVRHENLVLVDENGKLKQSLTTISAEVEAALQREQRQKARADKFEKRATEDGLTKTKRREELHDQLTRVHAEITDRRSSSRGYCIIVGDLDHFKVVNDTHGHPAGDEVLSEAAARLRSHVHRDFDHIYRVGGEEFTAYLDETGLMDGAGIADKMRVSIQGAPFDLKGTSTNAKDIPLTMSFGVAAFDAAIDKDYASVLARADAALYEAKRSGRNCVFMSAGVDENVPLAPDAGPHLKGAVVSSWKKLGELPGRLPRATRSFFHELLK